jgi:hypothetical protein
VLILPLTIAESKSSILRVIDFFIILFLIKNYNTYATAITYTCCKKEQILYAITFREKELKLQSKSNGFRESRPIADSKNATDKAKTRRCQLNRLVNTIKIPGKTVGDFLFV